jgi:hypothetical protein
MKRLTERQRQWLWFGALSFCGTTLTMLLSFAVRAIVNVL